MAKRFQLERYVAGPATKQILGTVLSGTTSATITTELRSDVYVAGQQGNLLTTPVVSADNTWYNLGYFDREYSVNHEDLVTNGDFLNVWATDSDVTDVIQFGNFAFNLTNETTLGTRYTLETTPTGQMFREPHEICTYVPGSSGDQINLIISNISFNVTPETPDLVYGLVSGTTLVLYVKALSGVDSEVYSLSTGVPNNLPFAYLLEQPLSYSPLFGDIDTVYGGISGVTTFAYTVSASLTGDNTLYSPNANEDDDRMAVWVNPFKLKNMYNNNWNSEYNTTTEELTGVRDYLRVGKTQETLWLSYQYWRDTTNDIQNYDLVERVNGLYKYQAPEGHKSNIYSIRITNSGLNDGLTDEDVKTELRAIIQDAVLEAVAKIAPFSTQLWKIEWEGQ